MTANFPNRWPPNDPTKLQLYSLATPNGKKVGVALEEMGVAYDAHLIDIMEGEQRHDDFLAMNPNGKIPVILDPNGPGGGPVTLFESGAILVYLAEKTGNFLPIDAAKRAETLQWLFFQMGGVGPMFGQFGHFFKFAREKTNDDYSRERYTAEAKRLLGVLDQQLGKHTYLAGEDYTIADIATFPWIDALDFYEGKDAVGYDQHMNVKRWMSAIHDRPAVKAGVKVCAGG